MKKILIIENDESLVDCLEKELIQESYYAETCLNGREGLALTLNKDKNWDLIITGLIVPELNGLEICRRIRQVSHVPIFIITARDSIIDRVSGLDYGADDYLIKPFAIEELLARMRALFRRIKFENNNQGNSQSTINFKDLIVEKENRLVRRGKEIIDLTNREYDLLIELLTNINTVYSRKTLLEKVWGYSEDTKTNVVDVYIRYLRNKIDKENEESYIQTVHGTGYVIRQ